MRGPRVAPAKEVKISSLRGSSGENLLLVS
jgi:hypothetical protein